MKKTFLILLLSVLTAGQAAAWDAVGHRIVAETAYNNLTKKARRQVDRILGTRGIVYTSSWPDEIKSDTIYPQSHVWHYQNLRAGLTPADIEYLYLNPAVEGKHAFYALDSLVNVLKTDREDEVALKFVVHIMGDVFQPMHLGHPDDKGGNKVQMRWFSHGTNLHAVWDRWLIDYTNLSSSEFVRLLEDTYGPQKKDLQRLTMLECYLITYGRQQAVYAWQQTGDTNTYHYAYRFRRDLDLSLYTAGIKLAQLLNEIYR
ncbi:MAG: S1/P1 nuclease [Paludibacteraceae bacterium]|nr:S1/P1 nuclease [Paludibacteraceae bacterium]MBQ9705271.1 S1/P1 nuclease [Paludibacteraceae bacterium]